MGVVRRLFWCQILASLLAGTAAGGQIASSNQNGQSAVSPPGSTVTSEANEATRAGRQTKLGTVNIEANKWPVPLPKLPGGELNNCMGATQTQGNIDLENSVEDHSFMLLQISACKGQMDHERWIVLNRCLDRDGKIGLPMVIAACTVALRSDILPDNERYLLFVNRADAYLAEGYQQQASDDYNGAVKWAPHDAYVYYNRGAFYVTQGHYDSALQDLNTALGINAKFAPALALRAKIYRIRGNFSGAFTDYSAAILLQPKDARLWSERGYVCLRQRDYEGAINDEAQAIQLDPKLARAYFLRGAAFGGLGDSGNAASNINAALSLDSSLNGHVVTQGKNVSLTLPLPP